MDFQEYPMFGNYLVKKISKTVFALIFFNGKASTHLVKQSIMTVRAVPGKLYLETDSGS